MASNLLQTVFRVCWGPVTSDGRSNFAIIQPWLFGCYYKNNSLRWDPCRVPVESLDTATLRSNANGEVKVGDFLKYTMHPDKFLGYGYPVEWEFDRSLAVIFGTPKVDSLQNCNSQVSDGERTMPEEVAEEESAGTQNATPEIAHFLAVNIPPASFHYSCYNGFVYLDSCINRIAERECVRCNSTFYATSRGYEYIYNGNCIYHWGKLRQLPGTMEQGYICCGNPSGSPGCTKAPMHVWDGLIRGQINGPFEGFVSTMPRRLGYSRQSWIPYAVLGLDCEMCFTTKGFEVCKVAIVNINGDLIYNSFVRPENRVIDYNTRFSGVCHYDLFGSNSSTIPVKSLQEVQWDLLQLIFSDTIIVGHGLENDLRVLKIFHKRIVDTSLVFPHYYGLPYRRSLKSLAFQYLNRQIQCHEIGHDSREDAKACLDLMIWKILHDKNEKYRK